MCNVLAIPMAAASLTMTLHAAEKAENIPPDWRAVDRQLLQVAGAEASASLNRQYAPHLVHDGDRKTKWVSPKRPSASAPQWVTLALAGGLQEVSAVAVFGERVDNDGILDAEIQVETDGGFKTVASVKGATSPGWLATFDPVRTDRVRLQITRSAGPTAHTDVWEVEVYGRTLSDEELEAFFAEILAAARTNHDVVAKALRKPGLTIETLPPVVRRTIRRVRTGVDEAVRAESQWDQKDHDARSTSVRHVNRTLALAKLLRHRTDRAAKTGKGKAKAMADARAERKRIAARAEQPGAAVTEAGPDQTKIANEELLVEVDSGTGRLSAVWADGIDAAVVGAKFSVEVDGKNASEGQPATSVKPVTDPLGAGQELKQVWESASLRVEREIRVYDHLGVLTVGGRITNRGQRNVTLGTTRLLDVADGGWWWLGQAWESPAAVYIAGHSLLRVRPFESHDVLSSQVNHGYGSSGVLALTSRDPTASLTIGYARADEAAPHLSASFTLDEGGTRMAATSRFLNRILGPGETVELNRVYLSASTDPYASLESYGQAMAKFAPRPLRTGATALWCSWYAHRMGMTEDLVLANAAVAARHLKPLGFEIMQLDHGWQRGDVTGDWVPNERFGHGLKWLADELQRRHGLRLGVWIAPTDAADTSQVFKQHPDWMLKGADGKPRVNWKWYWAPNPNCYELDATHPGAFKYIEDSFRQLTAWGVSYYKIDFIAASGGEHFIQHNPKTTRGWSVLRRAMQAIRAGAGDEAWIRYCQTPPILSAGLADSAYGGGDTLDAGVPGRFDVLRDNAHALAAGFWLNDRPYHREVCDMSVRMQGSVEEVRVRAAIMTLAGCSISFSDEFCFLPPSRIRLMQQCLPPGNPPMKPIDLFDRSVPSIWHLRCANDADTWDVVGLFNFNAAAEPRKLQFDRIGLDPKTEYAVFEFWEEKFLGLHKGGIELTLPPESSRILSIRKRTGQPQLIGTDMHLLQGYHEIKKLSWNSEKGILSGTFSRMPGITGKAFFYVPDGYSPKFDFPLSATSASLTHVGNRIWMKELEFQAKDVVWSIPFNTPK